MATEELSSNMVRRISIKEVDGLFMMKGEKYAVELATLLANYRLVEIYKVVYQDYEQQCSELLCYRKGKFLVIFEPKYDITREYHILLCLKHYNEFKKILKLEE
jgi:hypothetical protein